MPWKVVKESDGFFVVKKGSGEKVHSKPHPSRDAANQHMAALYSAEGAGKAEGSAKKSKTREAPKPSPKRFRQ